MSGIESKKYYDKLIESLEKQIRYAEEDQKYSSIKRVIETKNYEWSIARVTYDGEISFE